MRKTEDSARIRRADVVVVGGGPSGLCAAVAAARLGADVLVVEQSNCCGGMATQGLVGPFMTCYDREGKTMIIRGLFAEIVDRLVERGAAIHPSQVRSGTSYTSWITVGHDHVTPFEPEGLKLLSDEMLQETGVRVMYHTTFLEPLLEENAITGVVVCSKSGIERIGARVVIDCTGDADVAYRSGVPCELGNQELGIMQPATMFFHISNVDSEALEADIQANISTFHRKNGVNYRSLHWWVSKARAAGDWNLERVSVGLYQMPKKDEWCVNTSRIMGVNSTDVESLTRGEIIGRAQADQVFRFLKKYVPGCADARLVSTASYLGIRESRHIQGEYCLTLEDILHAQVPEDSILLCANSVDVHGRFGPESNEYLPIEDGSYYGVPYRCLLPVKVEGLLVAGRPVSACSEAAGAIRVMPPCMAMGQAAGTAAALAVHSGKTPRQIDPQELCRVLKENGVYL